MSQDQPKKTEHNSTKNQTGESQPAKSEKKSLKSIDQKGEPKTPNQGSKLAKQDSGDLKRDSDSKHETQKRKHRQKPRTRSHDEVFSNEQKNSTALEQETKPTKRTNPPTTPKEHKEQPKETKPTNPPTTPKEHKEQSKEHKEQPKETKPTNPPTTPKEHKEQPKDQPKVVLKEHLKSSSSPKPKSGKKETLTLNGLLVEAEKVLTAAVSQKNELKLTKNQKEQLRQSEDNIEKLREDIAKLENNETTLIKRREQLIAELETMNASMRTITDSLCLKSAQLNDSIVKRDIKVLRLIGGNSTFAQFNSIAEMKHLCQKLPKTPLHFVGGKVEPKRLSSPRISTDNQLLTFDSYSDAKVNEPRSFFGDLCAHTISTYPFLDGVQMGSPICDFYGAAIFNDRTLVCLSDGCGWGLSPREAALRATLTQLHFMEENHTSAKTVREFGELLVDGLARAHSATCMGKKEDWEAGSTTTIAGALMKTISKDRGKKEKKTKEKNEKERRGSVSEVDDDAVEWVFTFLSLGDCKAFLYSHNRGRAFDLTSGNRLSISDATDPGGRIGPYLEFGMPDLRNLMVKSVPCEQYDLLIIVSDGVHDNLDPELLGLNPNDLSAKYVGCRWDQPEHAAELSRLKENYMCQRLVDVLFDRLDEKGQTSNVGSPLSKILDPTEVVTKLNAYCENVCKASQAFMQTTNRDMRLISNYRDYPGKLDHTTCICIKVDQPAVF